MSELALQVKKGKDNLVKRAAIRLNKFYDSILIDEFQDFREHDYELIIKLAKHLNNVLLVGDYYQHSVSGKNNTGKPFETQKRNISYIDFVNILRNENFDVDTTTLSTSRRCSADVCNYICCKLRINISSYDNHRGAIIWIDDIDKATSVLVDNTITKLVYSNSAKYLFNALNWSYSKGDTLNCACVILTDKFEKLDEDDFKVGKIPSSTINKLYVAMTRSRGDLYLVKASVFKKIQKEFIKN